MTLAALAQNDIDKVIFNSDDLAGITLILEVAARTKDGLGTHTIAWSTHASGIKAMLAPREADIAPEPGRSVDHSMETRFWCYLPYVQSGTAENVKDILSYLRRTDVSRKSMRLKWDDSVGTRYFQILTAIDVNEQHLWIKADVIQRPMAWFNR